MIDETIISKALDLSGNAAEVASWMVTTRKATDDGAAMLSRDAAESLREHIIPLAQELLASIDADN
jgi:hypothetical protein